MQRREFFSHMTTLSLAALSITASPAHALIDKSSGLRVSNYLSALNDETKALQAAVNDLLSSHEYLFLDLEGRNFQLTRGINFGEKITNTHKTIMNGTITAIAEFPEDESYLIDFAHNKAIQKFFFINVEFRMNKKANGIRLTGNYVGFYVQNCHFTNCKAYAIYDSGESVGHDLVVDGCLFNQASAEDEPLERGTVGIYCASPDAMIISNIMTYFGTCLQLTGGGYVINSNHLYQGAKDKNDKLGDCIVFENGSCNSIVVGNYIDNGCIRISNRKKSAHALGNVTITGNRFLAANTDGEFAFIAIEPNGRNVTLSNIIVNGNIFKNQPHAKTTLKMTRVDDANGDLDYKYIEGLFFSANGFESVEKQENPATLIIVSEAENKFHKGNFTNRFPFSTNPQQVTSIVSYNMSNLSAFNVSEVKGKTVTIETELPTKGKFFVTATCNTSEKPGA